MSDSIIREFFMGTVLVVADIKDSCVATPRGLEIAHKLGHAVEVVAFTYAGLGSLNLSGAEQKSMKKQLMAVRENTVQARIDKFRRPGQKVNLRVVWAKNIDEWIIRRSAKTCEMVVKTGHRSEHLGYTSTDWRLLRECDAPVMITAEKKWHRTRPVLAALDLGTKVKDKKELNHKVLATAKALAGALDSELQIICAIEIPALLADLDLVDPRAYVKEAKAKMQPSISALAKAHDLPEKLFRVKKGPVEKVIGSDAAKQRAQLVVMGTVGRKGVKARLMGNTAELVLRHLKTDVLALKLAE
jgi:universal stress protein E